MMRWLSTNLRDRLLPLRLLIRGVGNVLWQETLRHCPVGFPAWVCGGEEAVGERVVVRGQEAGRVWEGGGGEGLEAKAQ